MVVSDRHAYGFGFCGVRVVKRCGFFKEDDITSHGMGHLVNTSAIEMGLDGNY